MRFDDNFLIYHFHTGLKPLYNAYCEYYNQTHDAIDDEGKAKFTLDYAITRFLNTTSNSTSSASLESQALIALVNGSYGHTSQSVTALVAAGQTEVRIQPGANASNSRVIIHAVKYCSHCTKDYHEASECIQLHPHLKKRGSDNNQGVRGGRENGNKRGGRGRRRKFTKNDSHKDENSDNNPGTTGVAFSRTAIPKIAGVPGSSFVSALPASPVSASPTVYALSTTTALSHLWILQSGCTQHITRDRSVFKTFAPFVGEKPSVNGVHGMTFAQGYGRIELECAGKDGKRCLFLDNVWYVPDSGINVISQGHLEDQKCPIRLVPNAIVVGRHDVQFKRHPNRLYILDMWRKKPFCPAAISQSITALEQKTSKQDTYEQVEPEQDELEQDESDQSEQEQVEPEHDDPAPPNAPPDKNPGWKPKSKPINEVTLRMWHFRLGHLDRQSIIKLATMSHGMDLTAPPPMD